ncbi:transposase, partial [Streptomyces enissocaesilis]|uniref:transposase n=1 Tax=Streptomyces enissocaesilis TaxID=332589 RepID=UPI0031DBB9F4
MSMQPMGPGKIPAGTVRVARAAFPKGSLAITARDELEPLCGAEEFADLFPTGGRPARSPGRLALVLVLQLVEGLTDRQAAEAVRARIDSKYALGLDPETPGFDYSLLSEFRDRLVQEDAGRRILDGIPMAARDKGLLRTAGRARTDSTHVLPAARELSWLEMVIDWDSKRVSCPNGTINTGWREDRSQLGLSVVRAQFSVRDCRPCPVVRDCVPNFRAKGRTITLSTASAGGRSAARRYDVRQLLQATAAPALGEWCCCQWSVTPQRTTCAVFSVGSRLLVELSEPGTFQEVEQFHARRFVGRIPAVQGV